MGVRERGEGGGLDLHIRTSLPDPSTDNPHVPATRKRGEDPLPAALELLRREGPDALTMRNVAAEAGVTATALYRHYPDKEALIRALVHHVYGTFVAAMEREAGDDPLATLRAAARFLRAYGLEHPNEYRLLFAHPHGFGIDRYPEDFLHGGARGFRMLREVVGKCMETGTLAGDAEEDAGEVALTLYGHMHGLIMLYLAGRFPQPTVFSSFYDRSVERLIEGIGT